MKWGGGEGGFVNGNSLNKKQINHNQQNFLTVINSN